jgi:tetratricopeptide (TPR) repeat protein
MTGGNPPQWIPNDLKGIHSVLGQNLSRVDIAAKLRCDPDRLAALLWLLTATGWAHRAHPPAALVPLGSVATIQAGEHSTAPVTPSAPAPRARSTAPPKPAPTAKAPTSPVPAKPVVQAKAVVPSAPRPAPKPPPTKAQAPTNPVISLAGAKAAINEGDFDSAYATLSKIRKDLPSCPDTLASLGWSAWRTGNLGTNAYDGPEDYLLLALTFDADHPLALEYYARIAIDKGEFESARNRLLQVLRTTPDSIWAKEALDEITPKGGNKGGIRLWPKRLS